MENRINQQIKETEVRLVSLPKEYKEGVYPIAEAIKIAEILNLDLIEVSNKSLPVICKIMDISKFRYEQKKKEKDNKKNQKSTEVKEMQLSPDIGDHDLETKVRKSKDFLIKGNKVKVTLTFKGRNIIFKERGELVMLKFADLLKDEGVPESMPKLEGKKMSFLIKPKK